MINNSSKVTLRFRGDDLVIIGKIPSQLLQFEFKKESSFTRFLPCDFYEIISIIKKLNIDYETQINQDLTLPFFLTPKFILRDYQRNAFDKWLKYRNGTLILPTGSGKTIVGLMIIKKLCFNTLIVVPTLDLVNQWVSIFDWFEELKKPDSSTITIGKFGGGEKNIQPITVATYESARLYSRKLRDKYGLIIFDEVHHLSESWKKIAQSYIAPYRLGLTATLEPEDENYNNIVKYVGPIVYQVSPEDLRSVGAIANFEIKKILVSLPPELKEHYDQEIKVFREYMKKKRLFGKKGFQKLIFQYQNPEARKALESHRKCRNIAFNALGKLNAIKDILIMHTNERIILFCESIAFIEQISQELLIPVISSKTSPNERKSVIAGFKNGNLRVIAAGRVLDEGVDVAQASCGIIISGSAQKRQFIQRLGRVLRPHPGKKLAILYEIITKDTSEVRTADRRQISV